MKRTPLNRNKPLSRGSGLKATKPPERRTELARRSPKRAKEMAEHRIPLVKALVEAGVRCEMSMVYESLGIAHRCQGRISGLHERRKSSSGGSRLHPDNLVPACSWCNTFAEDAVGEDRRLIEESYLVVREGDPDWDRLSKRHDKALDDDA